MEAVFTANHLTVTDKQTIRKKRNINHKNAHINTIQIKENKLNIQQKQNYPDSVASYDTQPGNEVGLFYNGLEHHTGHSLICRNIQCQTGQALQKSQNVGKGVKNHSFWSLLAASHVNCFIQGEVQ